MHVISLLLAILVTGFLIMPPLFGVIAEYISIALLPPYLLIFAALVLIMHERMMKSVKSAEEN